MTRSAATRELLAVPNENRLQLPNENFDTGKPTRLGDYHLADETYAKLVERLNQAKVQVSAPLQANIDALYRAAPAEPCSRAEGAGSLGTPLATVSRANGSTTAIRVPLPGSEWIDT